MKKQFLILLLSVICAFSYAQTVEMTYSFGAPTLTQLEGYEQVQMRGCLQSALPGQPSLPWQQVSLMLPEGQEAESIEVILSDFQELEGSHELFPYQPSRTYSKPERRQFYKDEAVYNSKALYPAKAEGQLNTQYMNGIGFAFSTFTPVQYEPATGKLSYATKARVVVHTTASKADHSRMLWMTPNNVRSAQRLAQNPEMIQSYDGRGRVVAGYDLLVVVTAQWADQFEAYKDFYEARGFRTQIVTLEDVLNTMTGQDSPEKLRNYIIQEYQDNGIQMVNLAGDVPDIPYRGLYCYVTSGGGNQEDGDIPADLYYAALDGTWNDNGNNWWGEIGEEDLLPELGIGRMCFSSQEELNNMLHKTFTYQTDPVLGEFQKVTMAGEHLYDDPLSNGSQYLELLIGERDDNGYTTIGIPEDYDFTRLYYENGTWNGDNLMAAINAGTQYVHHDGHANTTYVADWYNSDITDSNFSGANGVDHNYTFFHTSGCICGDFASNCILEKMTKIANFAVATIGNSRYGWFNEGQTEGPAIHLHRETEDAYYYERIPQAGLAMAEGKRQTAPWVTAPGQWEEGALRWNFYDLNLMGDVALCAWHDEPFNPDVTYESEILVGLSSTNVTVSDANGDGLKNFRCALFHGEDLIGVGYTDENGDALIEFAEPLDFVDEMSLIVTGSDAWPQTFSVLSLPGDCAYVIYNNYSINDGGNGQADFGESFTFNMDVKNVGTVATSNVTATLSTESEYITITDAEASIANIGGNEIVSIADAFSVTVSDNVPDMTNVLFLLTCNDGTDTWTSKFNIKLHAPSFTFTEMSIDDASGNNNGDVDPGETVTVHFRGMNAGSSAAQGVVFDVYGGIDEISFDNGNFPLGTVEAGSEFSADFTFTLSENATYGIIYQLPIAVYSGAYLTEDLFSFSVGQVMEDFESGDLSSFEWTANGNNPWTVVNDNPYAGSYCCRSGSIGDSEETSLSITVEVYTAGSVSFYKKVSTENNYDKLFFYIDDNAQGNWSGEVAWSQESYNLTTGTHTLRWTYKKDIMMTSGSDCVWVDNIVFPPTQVITMTEEVSAASPVIFPNPNNGTFTLDLPEEECEVTVFNSLGQEMYRESKAMGLTTMNLSHLSEGIYFVTIKSDTLTDTYKFIKE